MSKSTETTNDRVPRVLVRFGKHPSSVWKHHRVYGNTHRACGNTHRACGNIIERGETLVSRGETHIERGETWGCTEALPKAKRRGVGGV